jgi:hypothetical protein
MGPNYGVTTKDMRCGGDGWDYNTFREFVKLGRGAAVDALQNAGVQWLH